MAVGCSTVYVNQRINQNTIKVCEISGGLTLSCTTQTITTGGFLNAAGSTVSGNTLFVAKDLAPVSACPIIDGTVSTCAATAIEAARSGDVAVAGALAIVTDSTGLGS